MEIGIDLRRLNEKDYLTVRDEFGKVDNGKVSEFQKYSRSTPL